MNKQCCSEAALLLLMSFPKKENEFSLLHCRLASLLFAALVAYHRYNINKALLTVRASSAACQCQFLWRQNPCADIKQFLNTLTFTLTHARTPAHMRSGQTSKSPQDSFSKRSVRTAKKRERLSEADSQSIHLFRSLFRLSIRHTPLTPHATISQTSHAHCITTSTKRTFTQ